jgi:energy-coupling factor transport system ATP-binding protein
MSSVSQENQKIKNVMRLHKIAIVGVLLATGSILRYFLAMLNTPLTPNVIIAFYCLAIIVVKPKIFEALGIGLIAGFLSMGISGSVFPPANLVSELVGAYVCFIFYEILMYWQHLTPLVTTFVTTLASGFTFAGIATIFAGATILAMYYGNFREFVAVYVSIVVVTAVFNAILVQILCMPLSRLINRKSV